MSPYILDTNLFFNMEENLGLGEKTEEVICNLTKAVKLNRDSTPDKRIILLMPPRIVEEFLSFFEDQSKPFIQDYLSSITVQSPSADKASCSGHILYSLIADIRERSYRGLRIGEEEIVKAGKITEGKTFSSKKDFEMYIGNVTRTFRERYRQATRFGFLDSVADLDLILLSKEKDGILVSTDSGVLQWGRIFGVKEMSAASFGHVIRAVLAVPPHPRE